MTNDLMVNEFEGLNALKIMNCYEERRKWYSGAFIWETENEGDLSRPNLEEKFGPLDQNPTVGCQEHDAAQST